MEKNHKKILILNRRQNINALFFFFKELSASGASLILYSTDEKIRRKFKENNFPSFRLNYWPACDSTFCLILCFIFYPIVFFYILVRLWRIKQKHGVGYLLIFDSFDKIFTAKTARLLGIKVVSLISPESCPGNKGTGFAQKLENDKKTQTFCLTERSKNNLSEQRYSNIRLIPAGIKLGLGHQDNIFSGLAKEKNRLPSKKFFSVGTVLGLDEKHNLEIIFQGIKKSQTVIPNIQFIIIGDGKERKNLQWLARQIGIETVVWFVGEQKCLKKWLPSLDAYVFGANRSSLADINYALLAMSSALPIIMPRQNDLEEFSLNFKQGLWLDENTPDEWSRLFIKLQQNKKLRLDLGASAKQRVEENYTVERMAEEFLNSL